ncbi:acryloyl-CoA reductase [Pseudonocardia kujensis]|uniref:acrylyl-CoA reductase family protein n=1 Tax=Pseudonocardia kujensis TaxID=1128675 RepID=UPI001E2D5474|nr:acryloyl-CoA reductase [Pseudonocardia kujensis]MCE0764945.1 acryloyl-CoA reductase [Pseudonocardia kujensis]
MTAFHGWIVRKEDGANTATLEALDTNGLDDLDTTVRVRYSSINYKDALALHGRPGVIRRTPLIPGIDLTGEVIETRHARWKPGDVVTLSGAGLGEDLHGGLAGIARVNGDDLVPVPDTFTPAQAAALGTAGFTAALALLALERHGLTPGDGPLLVTGASGGSGSIAVALSSRSGYRVVAATGRPEQLRDRLTGLGAAEIIDRAELQTQTRPLGTQRWAGVIDSAGGAVLAGALATLQQGAAAAAFGLAAGSQLPTTVLPFILRGVSLLGIDSVRTNPVLRQAAWERLARDLDPAHLDAVTRAVPLDQAKTAASALLEGRGTGRTVVEVTP